MELKELNSILADNPWVTESEFSSRFCRILFNMNPENRDEYLRFVGNSFMPLNVVDDLDNSKVLFVVPGIDIRPTFAETTEPLLDVMDYISKISRINPRKAKEIGGRLKALVGRQAISAANLARWIYVVDNYNVNGKITSVADVDEPTSASEWDDDGLIDEEF